MFWLSPRHTSEPRKRNVFLRSRISWYAAESTEKFWPCIDRFAGVLAAVTPTDDKCCEEVGRETVPKDPRFPDCREGSASVPVIVRAAAVVGCEFGETVPSGMTVAVPSVVLLALGATVVPLERTIMDTT